MNESQKQKLELTHRNLVEQLDFVDLNRIPELIEGLKIIAEDLGDAIYLPDFNHVVDLPPESYSCDKCGSTNLRTILMRETLEVDLKPTEDEITNLGTIYIKTCQACGHIYHVDSAGKLCQVD